MDPVSMPACASWLIKLVVPSTWYGLKEHNVMDSNQFNSIQIQSTLHYTTQHSPPSNNLSTSIDPVVSITKDLRSSKTSAAVLKSMETRVLTIPFNLLTLASLIPLTSPNLRVVVCARLSTVWYPASVSFWMSFAAMPWSISTSSGW